MYIAWVYIGSRIRIYVHIILYTYTSNVTVPLPLRDRLGGRTSAEMSLALPSGTERNHDDIVLPPPFSWTSIVLSQGRS